MMQDRLQEAVNVLSFVTSYVRMILTLGTTIGNSSILSFLPCARLARLGECFYKRFVHLTSMVVAFTFVICEARCPFLS